MQILVGDKPGYSVPEVFFVYGLLQNEIFVITVWGYGKRNNVVVVENLTNAVVIHYCAW